MWGLGIRWCGGSKTMSLCRVLSKCAKLVYILKARHRGRGNVKHLEIPKPRDLEIQIEV